MEWCDNNASTPGCGYKGCNVIMGESLWILLDQQEILCFKCKTGEAVDAQEGCPNHPETKLQYLIIIALGQIANWYNMKAKIKLLTVVTLPHIEMLSSPARQIFLLDITQGLKFHPYVKPRSPAILDLFLGGRLVTSSFAYWSKS